MRPYIKTITEHGLEQKGQGAGHVGMSELVANRDRRNNRELSDCWVTQ